MVSDNYQNEKWQLPEGECACGFPVTHDCCIQAHHESRAVKEHVETVGDEAKTVGPDAVHQLDERETLHTRTDRRTCLTHTMTTLRLLVQKLCKNKIHVYAEISLINLLLHDHSYAGAHTFNTYTCFPLAFSDLMLLVGRQEGHPAWWGAGVVICLERRADSHMVQLMPLPPTVSCFSKIHIGFTFLVPAHPGNPEKGLLNVCVCNLLFQWHAIHQTRKLFSSIRCSQMTKPWLSSHIGCNCKA